MSAGSPPFKRVLIANRGEIAVRIARTCRELGIEVVAVHSDVDASALHVRHADVAVEIGPAPASDSYLRGERIVEAALRTGAEAVHPGYGFLSEQAAFAELVEAAGLAFVGPAPQTLAGLGDKLAARQSARRAGVPVVPGTDEALMVSDADGESDAIGDPASLARLAEGIGFPLLIKAAAGGGGRGMRRVDSAADLGPAVAAAARESEQAFGDGSLYFERLVEGARHVEVQLLGDTAGAVVALGERDCSTQRRHQKLVEEAPAPGLTREQRADLHGMAVRVAQEVGLRNAATVEFLLAPDGTLHFLEVNARLQVEHGITELLTGIDLVRAQLEVAAGRPLSEAVRHAARSALDPECHAIELRISAEDPAREFLPAPGLLTRWREPGGPGVRVDSGVEAGWRVPPDYDPLLAKVMVVAHDRESAIARAARAMGELEVGGLQTTQPFHAWLLAHPGFREARLRTDLVARDWDPAPLRRTAAGRAAAIVARHVWAASSQGARPAAPGDSRDLDTEAPQAPHLAWRDAGRHRSRERWQ